jgi:hypothetical protein
VIGCATEIHGSGVVIHRIPPDADQKAAMLAALQSVLRAE